MKSESNTITSKDKKWMYGYLDTDAIRSERGL